MDVPDTRSPQHPTHPEHASSCFNKNIHDFAVSTFAYIFTIYVSTGVGHKVSYLAVSKVSHTWDNKPCHIMILETIAKTLFTTTFSYLPIMFSMIS